MDSAEQWHIDRDGARHAVEISGVGGLGRRVIWTLDSVPVAERTTHEDRVVLDVVSTAPSPSACPWSGARPGA